MADFDFRKHVNGTSVVLAPRRAKRTNENGKKEPICPFCIGREAEEEELYRVGGQKGDSNWKIRVIPNKFPFTPHHELIIHSPDHHKNFDELPFEQVELILQTYVKRYQTNEKYGQVYIFHNRGHAAGESVPHPHTQLTVIPQDVTVDILPLDKAIYTKGNGWFGKSKERPGVLETDHFMVFCPETSDWPDEVWLAPKRQNIVFGELTQKEVTDFAFVLSRIVQIQDLRHGY